MTREADGLYRGTISADVIGTFSGMFLGERCTGHWSAWQDLFVVGRPQGPSVIDQATETITEGVPDGGDLLLAFYPLSAPDGTGFESFTVSDPTMCAQTIGFDGGGPDNQPPGEYLPFNDSRFTTPDLGLQIHLPASGSRLQYVDTKQSLPAIGIDSTWDIMAVAGPVP